MGLWKKFVGAARCRSPKVKKEEKFIYNDFPDDIMLNRISTVNAFRRCFLELETELKDTLKEGAGLEPSKYVQAYFLLLQTQKTLHENFGKIQTKPMDSLDHLLFKVEYVAEWGVLDKKAKKVLVRWINYANMIMKAIHQLRIDLYEEFPRYSFLLSLLLTYETK